MVRTSKALLFMQTHLHLVSTSPGNPALVAAAFYLRPIDRGPLLQSLGELGLFVREYPALPELELWHEAHDFDMAILAGSSDPAHAAAAVSLRQRVTPALVVLTPDETSASMYAAAEPLKVIPDHLSPRELTTCLGQAAQEARTLRRPLTEPGVVMLGKVRYRVADGLLEGKGRALGLSQAERGILGRLLESPGVPVALEELERELRPRPGGAASELRAAVTRLRRKFQELGGNPWAVGTVRGFGYVLVP